MFTDIRLAVRTLRRDRVFTATAAFTLAVAMTMSTAVLTVLTAYLYRGLPYPRAERLHSIRYGEPGAEQPRGMERLDWTSLSDIIEHPIAWDLDMFYVLGGENAESVPGAWVTPGFVEGLGIRPAIGRGFGGSAFDRGSANVALISDRFSKAHFGGDAAALGRQFTAYVSDRPQEAENFTVIGVLPENFWHINQYTDILVPLRAQTYPYLATLREHVTTEEAAARITSFVRAGAADVPPNWSAAVVSTHDQYVSNVRPVLRSVALAAALVLLVGCANVAGLQLLRASRRAREMAVRTALGAGVTALARLLFAEALLLGGLATAVALGLTRLTVSSLAPLIQQQLGRPAPGGASSFDMSGWAILLAVGTGMVTVLICGLTPLLSLRRSGLLPALQAGARTATEGRRSRRFRAGLVALELAASLALVCGAALMLRTMFSLVGTDLGIGVDRSLVASITLRQNRYPDGATQLDVFERILSRLRSTGGVESAALMSGWPMQQPGVRPVEVDDGQRTTVRAAVHVASDAYFETLGIRLSAGRTFAPTDRSGAEPIAVVSESFARRAWPGESAVGRRLFISPQNGQRESSPVRRTIVGVVADVRQEPADEDPFDVYVPLGQSPQRFATSIIRTRGSPELWLPAVRTAFRNVDPEISLTRARPLRDVADEGLARPRFLAWLLVAFGAVAMLVSMVGVYGTMAYAVRQREREIAVRMAMGARRGHVVGMFLREGAVVILTGLALGLLGALATGRLLESQLFGVQPGDPTTITAAVALLGGVALAAVWWPSRRAASTDPAVALRVE